jgi:hypothetical protein
LVYFDV